MSTKIADHNIVFLFEESQCWEDREAIFDLVYESKAGNKFIVHQLGDGVKAFVKYKGKPPTKEMAQQSYDELENQQNES